MILAEKLLTECHSASLLHLLEEVFPTKLVLDNVTCRLVSLEILAAEGN